MRTCAQCGAELTRRANEGTTHYRKRRFCSRECGWASKRTVAGLPCTVDGCQKRQTAKGLCSTHYQAGYREQRAEKEQADLPPAQRKPPVRCVFCAAARILAAREYSAEQTAAAMGKPVAWIRGHVATCQKERKA